MSNSARRLIAVVIAAILVICLVISLAVPAFSAPLASPPAAGGEAPAVPFTQTDLEAFVESIVPPGMEKYHAPGAVVVAVQNGRIILKKGYGYANLESRQAVDPDTTSFRIGSVTKTLTATAVMQLVEAGRLDLRKDVNSYLSAVKVPATYDVPVTTFNLLTHTAGFDECYVNMETADYRQVPPLDEYLSRNLPPRVRAPGQVAQYSNHGMALAGYLVETVSGQKFEAYVTDHIFSPLGMTSSRPRLTDDALPTLAREYSWKGGKYLPMRLYDYNVYPAGSVIATGADMAKFMIAHLGDGSYGEGRILAPETLAEMHARHFGAADGLEGMAYAFYERYHGDRRFILHGGDTNGTHSFMLLDPAGQFGLFVSTNGESAVQLVMDLIEGFWDRFYPTVPAKESAGDATGASLQEDAAKVAGEYRTSRYPRTTFGKVLMLIQPTTRVQALADGNVSAFHDGRSATYAAVGGLTYRNPEDGTAISFLLDDEGEVAYLADYVPSQHFERLRWYESQPLHLAVVAASVLTFVLVLIGSLVRRARAGRGRVFAPSNAAAIARRDLLGWRLAGLTSLTNVLAIGAFLIGLASLTSVPDMVFITPTIAKIGLGLFAVAAALAVLQAVYTLYACVVRRGSLTSRLGLVGVTLMALAFAWVMNYYNMVGLKF